MANLRKEAILLAQQDKGLRPHLVRILTGERLSPAHQRWIRESPLPCVAVEVLTRNDFEDSQKRQRAEKVLEAAYQAVLKAFHKEFASALKRQIEVYDIDLGVERHKEKDIEFERYLPLRNPGSHLIDPPMEYVGMNITVYAPSEVSFNYTLKVSVDASKIVGDMVRRQLKLRGYRDRTCTTEEILEEMWEDLQSIAQDAESNGVEFKFDPDDIWDKVSDASYARWDTELKDDVDYSVTTSEYATFEFSDIEVQSEGDVNVNGVASVDVDIHIEG